MPNSKYPTLVTLKMVAEYIESPRSSSSPVRAGSTEGACVAGMAFRFFSRHSKSPIGRMQVGYHSLTAYVVRGMVGGLIQQPIDLIVREYERELTFGRIVTQAQLRTAFKSIVGRSPASYLREIQRKRKYHTKRQVKAAQTRSLESVGG